ncbi:TPA: HAD family hydrolase [Listeria innocua]|uniref:HAD family hydrolase n=1 Tax=Listeria innocua TaxID=1642 RepID=UPI0010DF3631|nr:HAD family hydrolase [Listeria innocua]ECL7818144.1 HAD family hydrolase [Listeria innocua]ECL7866491.1 HAD family hydrolase [Listeria innocua]ECX5117744.1 HAD family hydrolase [Listeria innocua]EIR6839717.1 HAD family hydrolase [Listeria innocua]MBC2133810.1 HAD family hydrolase [Listeria innocua]
MLKAVVMDFDGIVIDTEVVWYEIFKDWFKTKQHYDLSIEEFLQCVGSNVDDLFRELNETQQMDINRQAFEAETQATFIENSKSLPAKEGVESFIRGLKEHGLKLALATSSQRPKPLYHLERLGLLEYFDAIITAEDVTRIKPEPDLFLEALRALNVKPSEALIVEDSRNGLLAGNSAGVNVLVIPNEVTKHSDLTPNYMERESLADVDLTEIIAKYNK